ncbi:Protein sym-1 [Vitis vinifera]|uniref:Protein sym-1 n=1 Tax=Vitis vinifera TaxID=29760 RepID=A0A438DSP4_VITVI|nr:Protein sym-1 [Vitis vinifera]
MEGFFPPTRLGGVLSDTPPGKVVCILQILAALPLSLCIGKQCMSLHPVKTQVISSGILWGVGDITAQSITHSSARKRLQISHAGCPFIPLKIITESVIFGDFLMDAGQDFKIDWKRTAITSMFGFGFVGPVGHFWLVVSLLFTMMNSGLLDGFLVMILVPEMFLMQLGQYIAYTYEGLDRFIRLRLLLQPASVRFVASKVAMDSLIFGPFELFVFFSHMGFSTGKNAAQVKEDLKRDFLPALIVESGAWPFVQVVNFRYVPVRYQLLYVNLFCLLDSIFLSWMEQQKDASWKQWFSSSPSSKEQGHGGGR